MLLNSSITRHVAASTHGRQCVPSSSPPQARTHFSKCRLMPGSEIQPMSTPAPEPVPNIGREEVASRMSAAISKLSKAKQKVSSAAAHRILHELSTPMYSISTNHANLFISDEHKQNACEWVCKVREHPMATRCSIMWLGVALSS